MGLLDIGAIVFIAIASAAHTISVWLALLRCRKEPPAGPSAADVVPVSVVRPVCGVEPFERLTLGSTFTLSYPRYEIIFCCDRADDPVVPLVRELMAAHPDVPSRLLIGRDRPTANPKLNNLVKGWSAAKHEHIILADSNVLMPRDYIERLFAAWRPDTGLVCSPPVGAMPRGFWAELETAFLNTYQAKWQLAADSIGLGFAQGKSMLWRRSDLERCGGLVALGRDAAEDAAATKVVRSQGLRVRLVDQPFDQALGPRTAEQVWSRQLRWARLRRATFAAYFIPELFSGSVFPLAATFLVAPSLGLDPLNATLMLAAGWFGLEFLLARVAGWHLTWVSPVAWLVRDLLLPLLWCAAWLGNGFTWRGNSMTATPPHQNGASVPAEQFSRIATASVIPSND